MRKYFMILIGVVLMFGMVLPAAADVSFYGRVYFDHYIKNTTDAAATAGAQQTSDDDLIWEQDAGSSRFGANFKGEAVSANIELRRKTSSYVRHWNATWHMGGGKSLRFGQAYSPLYLPAADAIIKSAGYGSMADNGRNEHVVFTIPAGPAKIMITGFKPQTTYTTTISAAGSTSGTTEYYTDTDVSIPKLAISAMIPTGPVTIEPFYGFNNYDLEDTGTTQKSISVSSSAYGLRATVMLGAATIRANYFQATNFKIFSDDSFDYGPSYDGTTMYDSDYTGMHVSVAYKLSSIVALNAGYGVAASERTINAVTSERERTSTYANVALKLAKGVQLDIFHEIDDHGEEKTTGSAGVDQGEITYTGARWVIRF
jgi:hypothetical protein